MDLTDEEKAINKIKNKTVKEMQALGVYRWNFPLPSRLTPSCAICMIC